jgi:hypothetical protein
MDDGADALGAAEVRVALGITVADVAQVFLRRRLRRRAVRPRQQPQALFVFGVDEVDERALQQPQIAVAERVGRRTPFHEAAPLEIRDRRRGLTDADVRINVESGRQPLAHRGDRGRVLGHFPDALGRTGQHDFGIGSADDQAAVVELDVALEPAYERRITRCRMEHQCDQH